MHRGSRLSTPGVLIIRIYIDETQHKGYVVVAALVSPADEVTLIKNLRQIIPKGQSHIHMRAERKSRRSAIATTVKKMGCDVWIYHAAKSGGPVAEARMSCLAELARNCLATFPAVELIIEEDESMRRWDDQVLTVVKSELGEDKDRLIWTHTKPNTRPLLSIPDVVGWCFQASDRSYFKALESTVTRKVTVDPASAPVRVPRKHR